MVIKVLYMITLSEHGGAQANVRTLLAGMQGRADLALATSVEGWLTDEARAMGIPVHLVPEMVQPLSPWQDLQAVHALTRLFREVRPDLVHLHSSKAGLLGRIAARLTGIPAVFTAHGWAFTEGAPEGRRHIAVLSERLTAPLAARIISVSGYDTRLAERYKVGAPGQVVTIHNGLPDIGETPPPGPQSSLCRVVMTARFAPPKDQLTLIRAAAQVSGVHLTLIGDGEGLSAAQSLVTALGVQDRVDFLGARSDVPQLLLAADVFALISNYEGFPISILEGMRAGLPIIATDVGGVQEAVQSGVTGLLVPKGDEAALVAALRTLATDKEERFAMGRAARDRFKQAFTEEAMLDNVRGIYLDALLRRAL